MFFGLLHTSLVLIFVTEKNIVAKLTALQIPHYGVRNYFHMHCIWLNVSNEIYRP